MAPSLKTLKQAFGQDLQKKYGDGWEDMAAVLRSVLKRGDGGSHKQVDKALEQADVILGGYGVEAGESDSEGWDPYYGDIAALYVNMGDTYTTTILYDTARGHFYVTRLGDWAEAYERHGGQLR